jgi:hypothetical protein
MGKSGLGPTFRLQAPRVGVRNTFDFGGSRRVMPGQRTMNTTQTMTIRIKISR